MLSRNRSLFSLKITCIIFVTLYFSSCKEEIRKSVPDLKKQLERVDSLYMIGDANEASALLNSLASKIKTDNYLSSTYYNLVAGSYRNVPLQMELFADSALIYFSSTERINEHQDEYFKALLLKGDVSIINQKYNTGLNYYYLAKEMVRKGYCDHGNLASKMAGIYYTQRNYLLSAKHWTESIKGLNKCKGALNYKKEFGLKQGAFNNAGYSYQLAGQLDSAMFYYNEDLKLITEAEKSGLLDDFQIKPAKLMLFDNIGGVKIEQGKLDEAKRYLYQCIHISTDDFDGIRIPPLLKIAEIQLLTGKLDKADSAFKSCKKLLDRYYKANANSALKYYRLYAKFKIAKNEPLAAYQYQQKYVDLKDTLEESSSKLYRLNVDGELKSLHQDQVVTDLTHGAKLKQVYLIGVIIIALMVFVIMLLFFRNLRNSKKNYKESILNNEQLQQALIELERINKNHLRIMQVMAHDLRNPISGINGLATLLLTEPNLTPDTKHMVALIESTSTNSMQMIDELLKSGLTDDNEPMHTEQIDLGILLQDSVKLLQFKAKEKQQQIVFVRDEQPLIAIANRDKMWRVFNNLIVNAIKFSHQGSSIKVNINQKDNQILVTIADEGVGIPLDDQFNVFEMFSPAKKMGTNGEQPFGLGLSISKKIIEKHNGKIWLTSLVDQGTTFYIEIPKK